MARKSSLNVLYSRFKKLSLEKPCRDKQKK